MFEQPQKVGSFVLSFLFLWLSPHPLPEKSRFLSDPLFRSVNSQSHCRLLPLLSIYPLSSVWLPPLSSPSFVTLPVSQRMVKWQCCQDGQ